MLKKNSPPYFFYPTDLVIVDDDEDFLSILKDSVITPCHTFSSPHAALQFLLHAHTPQLKHIYAIAHDDFHLKKQFFKKKMNPEITVMIIDYQMPGINGLDLCKLIKGRNIKIIMLTGEADLKLAVHAFNHLIIDKFIRKDSPTLNNELAQLIREMQLQYFQELGHFMSHNLSHNPHALPNFFKKRQFACFFNTLLQEQSIDSYYLLNHEGDFLLPPDRSLLIRDEPGLNQLIRDAEAKFKEEPHGKAEIIWQKIKSKQWIPFFTHLKTIPDFSDWEPHLHPLQCVTIEHSRYYYSLI